MLALLAAVVLQTAPLPTAPLPDAPPLLGLMDRDVAQTITVHLNRFW